MLSWRDFNGIRFHTAGHDHHRIIEETMAGIPEENRIVPGQVFASASPLTLVGCHMPGDITA